MNVQVNVQQEAVALYLFLEGRGFRPSIRSIARALRDQGVQFREAELRGWLSAFVKSRDATGTQMEPAGPSGTQKSLTREPLGPTRTQVDATGNHLRARDKVSLFSNQSPDGDGAVAPARPRGSRREPSVSDMAAYRILDAAFPMILDHVPDLRMTRKRWKQANKAAALDLVELSTKAEEVVDMLLVAYENPRARKYYGTITMLDKLVKHWPALQAIAQDFHADAEDLREQSVRGAFLPIL